MFLRPIFAIIIATAFIASCSPGSRSILSKKTPHETYGQRLRDAGLEQTALGLQWFSVGSKSLAQPVVVNLPFQEAGYFAGGDPKAVAYLFSAKRGEKINIKLTIKSIGSSELYFDLWEKSAETNNQPKLVATPEDKLTIGYVVKTSADFILRLQPELLKNIEYTIIISTGPSLAYPVGNPGNNHIKSLFGVGRDGGARKHEGIDMFAPLQTPLLAVSKGAISRVEQTQLGGKVVWLRPDDFNFSVYYAHLDQQLVQPGQQVNAGDTIGLMGNTGNAITTAPHLHFGIYAPGGAIDPYSFVYKNNENPPGIIAPLSNMGQAARVNGKNAKYSLGAETTSANDIRANTLIKIEGAYKNKFRIILPDGNSGYILSANLKSIKDPIRKHKIVHAQPLLDDPSNTALKIRDIPAGETVNVVAEFGDFAYVDLGLQKGWITLSK